MGAWADRRAGLVTYLVVLPIPVDAAVARAEKLLHDTIGGTWAEADVLQPLSGLCAYLGRSADARAAIDRTQSIFADFGSL